MRGSVLAEKLTAYLLREIMARGARGGPLAPLADQLNHDVTHLQGERITDIVRRIADAVGDGFPPDDLDREARALLLNLQAYLEHLGGMEALLALLPKGIWPAIGASARMLADEFIHAHDLHTTMPVLYESGRLRNAIEWLLQTSWIRGYVMYKFYKFDHVPAQPVQSTQAP